MSESAHRIMMNIFLLTPLREGRRHTPPDIDNNVSISTHAPAGGATQLPLRFLTSSYYFYSRPCGRGDQKPEVRTIRRYISTHAPAGGATSTFLLLILDLRRFLLTPLREGRLINLRDLAVHHVISTHAPAGGATVVAAVAAVRIRISTHAPAGGATRSARTLSPKRANFYSRPCGRGD